MALLASRQHYSFLDRSVASDALDWLLVGRLVKTYILYEHNPVVFATFSAVSLALFAWSPTTTLDVPLVAFGTSKAFSMAYLDE